MGALIAAVDIDSVELFGFALAGLNTITVSLLSVSENMMMRKISNEQTAVGMNMYRLATSIPILLLIAYLTEHDFSLADADCQTKNMLIASGLVCLFAGISIYSLQKVTTSTTILVANCGYKFITTIISIAVHGNIPTPGVAAGYLISTLGFLTYVLSSIRNAQMVHAKSN